MTSDRPGRELDFGDADGALRAYYAAPDAGFGPGALVLGEPGGSPEHLRDVCDQLARSGFAAMAPDPAETESDARLDTAIQAILSCEAVAGRRVAVVGFGRGGGSARRLAARSPRIGAVAHFEAEAGSHSAQPGATSVPCLRIVTEPDSERAPAERPLSGGAARTLTRVVPGARPDFMDATRPDVHDAAAASESWSVLVSFLRAELS